jgi:uncharacterized protein
MAGMDRLAASGGPVVTGFSAGGFMAEGAVHPALLLTPERAYPWSPPPVADLAAEDFAQLLALQPLPEFILLGTGARLVFPPRRLVADLDERGIGVEAMDSRAAARTWGLLRAEERWIAAALMPFAEG